MTYLMPAADTLIKVNQVELDKAYSAAESSAAVDLLLVFLSGGALVGGVVGLSWLLFKQMRRVINPPLASAAIVTVVCCLWAMLALWQSGTDIMIAKKEC